MVDSAVDEMTVASDAGDTTGDDPVKRERSLIAFPYVPLQDVIVMVQKIEERGHRCRVDELATDLEQQKTSGAFRSRLSAGRMFGATQNVRGDVSLTKLGLLICNPDTRPDALVDAFLHVPLYAKVYDKFSGGKLPGGPGIEGEMMRLGVPPKQAQKARQVFLRSADAADFFRRGRDRLVRPPASTIASAHSVVPASEEPTVPHAKAVPMAEHSLIRGLVAKLPAEGERFTPKQRQRWLEAAKVNLDLIYATDDEDEPTAEPSPNGVATAQPQPS
jgi:hypothetical protein